MGVFRRIHIEKSYNIFNFQFVRLLSAWSNNLLIVSCEANQFTLVFIHGPGGLLECHLMLFCRPTLNSVHSLFSLLIKSIRPSGTNLQLRSHYSTHRMLGKKYSMYFSNREVNILMQHTL